MGHCSVDITYKALLDIALQVNSFNDTITYDDLARAPDDWIGRAVQLTGKIVQMVPDEEGSITYRFAINGDYDQMIMANIGKEYQTDTLLEGDYAALSGLVAGMYSYESITGATITVPAVLAARMEITEVPTPQLPEYPTGPLTLELYYSTGRLRSVTEIESFSIVNAEYSYNGEVHISCEVIGTISGSSSLSLKLKCYDKDGFLLETGNIYASVSENERFRVTDDTYISSETCRIELTVE